MNAVIDRCSIKRCRYTARPLIAIRGRARSSALFAPGQPVLVTIDGGATWRSAPRAAASIHQAIKDARELVAAMHVDARARAAEERRMEERRAQMPLHDRVTRYVARFDAVSAGACGKGIACNSYNARAYRAVERLLRRFELSDGDAVAYLRSWAARCDPALPVKRLQRLIADARKNDRRAA